MSSIQTRKIVRIDEDKCDGCGVCVPSCAEGAIRVIDGKARLLAENLCDGLGNCLGKCPRDAITIEERPAEEFDEAAVEEKKASPDVHRDRLPRQGPQGQASGEEAKASRAEGAEVAEEKKKASGSETQAAGYGLPAWGPQGPATAHGPHGGGGCPGARLRQLSPAGAAPQAQRPGGASGPAPVSRLGQWPVQLALVPVAGTIWQDADVLIAADCVGFAMPDFHERLLAGKTLVIACPKLDDVEPYVAKLTEIFTRNAIRSITVAHMEVPCCGGIVRALQAALAAAGRTDIRMTDITVGIDGTISSVR
jgi:NAD-dependent dihydropyrimidine dehydrogenase PreA subunit